MVGTNGRGRQPKIQKDQLKKHYPWMEEFDNEAKACMTVPEVKITHVLKLVTMLERNVSPEVSKLKNRPNRATKFLKAIRKRISLTKIGGFIIDEQQLETKLFPTYGLLMTHIVNIYLISSMLEKLACQKIASEIYYFLKLMFQNDNEYILDVVLCSNLDEHTSSKHKVGYQLFSFIVEDWRYYSDSHPLLLKYCAVCALLLGEAEDGRQVIENHVPTAVIDKSFVAYLRQTLDIDFGGAKKKLNSTISVIQNIKPTAIKSFSRSRLILVSTRDVMGGSRGHSGSSDSSSSTVNLSNKRENGDRKEMSSSSSSSEYPIEDPMNQILGELGLGGGFFLDNVGQGDGQYETREYLMDHANDGQGVVSSLTRRSRQSSSSSSLDVKINREESESEEDFVEDDELMDIDSDTPQESSFKITSLFQRKKRSKVSDESEDEDERQKSEDESDDDGGDILKKSTSNFPSANISASNKTVKEEEDSDLEVVSVLDSVDDEKNDADSGCSSSSRDEEEAESGEDVVPNYDVDSDLEEDKKVAKHDGKASSVPAGKSEENIAGNIVNNEAVDSADDETSSNLTVKLRPSPVKGENTCDQNESDKSEIDNVSETVISLSRSSTLDISPSKSPLVVVTQAQSLSVEALASPLEAKANDEEESDMDDEDDNNDSVSPKRAKIENESSSNIRRRTKSKQNADTDTDNSQEDPDKTLGNRQTARRGCSRVSIRLVRTVIQKGKKVENDVTKSNAAASTTSTPTPTTALRRSTRATRATKAASSKKFSYDSDSHGENSEADVNIEEEEESITKSASTVKKNTRATPGSTRGRGRGRGRPPLATPTTRSSRRK